MIAVDRGLAIPTDTGLRDPSCGSWHGELAANDGAVTGSPQSRATRKSEIARRGAGRTRDSPARGGLRNGGQRGDGQRRASGQLEASAQSCPLRAFPSGQSDTQKLPSRAVAQGQLCRNRTVPHRSPGGSLPIPKPPEVSRHFRAHVCPNVTRATQVETDATKAVGGHPRGGRLWKRLRA